MKMYNEQKRCTTQREHEFKINKRVANIRKNVYSLLNELLTAMLNLIVNIKSPKQKGLR